MIRLSAHALISLVALTAAPGASAMAPPAACVGPCWKPKVGDTMHLQLGGSVKVGRLATIYDVDGDATPKSTVKALHKAGRRVVCYVSAGSYESYRADAAQFPDIVKGKVLDGWPDERWLDVRRIDLLAPILRARVKRCVAKDFDAVDFDNVDGVSNDSSFPLTDVDQLRFNKWLAGEAHRQGLAVALKNNPNQVARLAPWFDFSVVEQCFQYQECRRYLPMIKRGKPVFDAEYERPLRAFCAPLAKLHIDAARYSLALDGPRQRCPGK